MQELTPFVRNENNWQGQGYTKKLQTRNFGKRTRSQSVHHGKITKANRSVTESAKVRRRNLSKRKASHMTESQRNTQPINIVTDLVTDKKSVEFGLIKGESNVSITENDNETEIPFDKKSFISKMKSKKSVMSATTGKSKNRSKSKKKKLKVIEKLKELT